MVLNGRTGISSEFRNENRKKENLHLLILSLCVLGLFLISKRPPCFVYVTDI